MISKFGQILPDEAPSTSDKLQHAATLLDNALCIGTAAERGETLLKLDDPTLLNPDQPTHTHTCAPPPLTCTH